MPPFDPDTPLEIPLEEPLLLGSLTLPNEPERADVDGAGVLFAGGVVVGGFGFLPARPLFQLSKHEFY